MISSAQREKMEADSTCKYTEVRQEAMYMSYKMRNSGYILGKILCSEGGQALEQVIYSVRWCYGVVFLGDRSHLRKGSEQAVLILALGTTWKLV